MSTRPPDHIDRCAWCAASYLATYYQKSGRGWVRRLTCSPKCHRAFALAQRNPGWEPARCEICGETHRRRMRGQRTCSRVCGRELKRRNWAARPKPEVQFSQAIYVRRCPECETVTFSSSRAKLGYCSERCSDRGYNARRRSAWDRSDRSCKGCDCRFTPSYPKQAWCSADCAKRVRKRRGKRRRRALRLGVAHEPYTLAEISIRDGRRCGICRRSVPTDKAVPHPKAPTIDHIVPLAAGGDDTRANIQLAHFECNWRKSDRVDFVQPLLVG